ncbi:hypothetical protein LTR84_003120 [Exophiala bonariae]|uniref:Uncharacterized protein n=1 Tax=Exophiala bonariae TaxID=1690606 RepID=A0AAV9N7T6_9EURO|nr:hypothetical protein LTR84_003120 [Exophiala bonariae]
MWPFNTSSQPVALETAIKQTEIAIEPQVVNPLPPTSVPEPTSSTSITSDTWESRSLERLSLPFTARAPVMMGTSFLSGFILGTTKGATTGGDLFRAENAHRLPTEKNGWYQYHKTKNYRAMMSGLKEGGRYGAVCTAWWSLFMVTEEVIDRSRARLFEDRDDDHVSGQRDAASTVFAAMTVSGVYSWTNGLDHFAAAKIARTALRFSLAYGLIQDLVASARGRPPAYIAWLRS